MDYSLSGGSFASNYVNELAKKRCNNLKGGVHHHSKKHSKLHKINKKTSKKNKKKPLIMKRHKLSSKSRKSRKSKKSRKSRKSNKMKGGGSDWVTMLYSRGPVNNPSTYNEKLLRKFSKTGEFFDAQGKLNKRGNIGGGKRKSKKRKKKC